MYEAWNLLHFPQKHYSVGWVMIFCNLREFNFVIRCVIYQVPRFPKPAMLLYQREILQYGHEWHYHNENERWMIFEKTYFWISICKMETQHSLCLYFIPIMSNRSNFSKLFSYICTPTSDHNYINICGHDICNVS